MSIPFSNLSYAIFPARSILYVGIDQSYYFKCPARTLDVGDLFAYRPTYYVPALILSLEFETYSLTASSNGFVGKNSLTLPWERERLNKIQVACGGNRTKAASVAVQRSDD